jgi:hypothetical protein
MTVGFLREMLNAYKDEDIIKVVFDSICYADVEDIYEADGEIFLETGDRYEVYEK